MWLSWLQHQTGTQPTQVQFALWQGIFLKKSTFSADSLMVSERPSVQSRALTSVRKLKIHVRVWQIMETQKQPAYTLGWVVQFC